MQCELPSSIHHKLKLQVTKLEVLSLNTNYIVYQNAFDNQKKKRDRKRERNSRVLRKEG